MHNRDVCMSVCLSVDTSGCKGLEICVQLPHESVLSLPHSLYLKGSSVTSKAWAGSTDLLDLFPSLCALSLFPLLFD